MSDYTHILVAVDFSISAEQVLIKARQIAQRYNARLSLLHAVEYIPPIDSAYEPMLSSSWVIDERELLAQAKQSLQKLSNKFELNNAGLSVELGAPKHVIADFVKENQCDLVVIGSHGRHGLSLLLGSTANAVLHAMPCDILTVKFDE